MAAPVLPDVCFDEVTSNAELWDRTFAFISGSSEKQYCSECQPCPICQSHPTTSKHVPSPELPSPSLFCSSAVLCSFTCMDALSTQIQTHLPPSLRQGYLSHTKSPRTAVSEPLGLLG